ncbi:MAG: Flp pilus assembly complex ATPase component TadA [Bacilli bacterium]|nr:Flp pilus assembly complex ATPase component TadA [Bacilli bacterium]
MNENIFDKLDFGPFKELLDNDDITDVSYDNGGQIWIRSLTQGSMRVEIEGATPEFVEKLAFQCSNVMGTTFNNAKPFLDAESSELRMNFVHQSIATNGIALVIRKTPAKIRLEKEKLIQEDYFTPAIHDFLIKCVQGHCNIMVAGETGSGKTEFIKYLASHTATNEKIITIEDTLELHLDKIFPQRDIVAMKTNNVASYSDVLVTCMRQNPKWILLSEVRSAEAVSAVRNSISSGHNILSTIHADKASAIPYRLYSLMETDLDVHQFLSTIYRYIQLGAHIKAFYSKEYGKFHRELDEVCEFYVDDENVPRSRIIYQKIFGKPMMCRPSDHLIEYLENQNIDVREIVEGLPLELPIMEARDNSNIQDANINQNVQEVQPASEQVVSNSVPPTGVVSEQVVEVPITQPESVIPAAQPENVIPVVQPDNEVVSAPVAVSEPIEQQNVVNTNEIINGQAPSVPVMQNATDVQLAAIPAVNSFVPQQQVVIETPVNNVVSPVGNTPLNGLAKLEE